MAICPDLTGPRCSHRQRQYLPVEFANSLGVPHSDGEEVRRELADAGAAFSGHFAEAAVDDRCGTYLDLFAITFVWLGHAHDPYRR